MTELLGDLERFARHRQGAVVLATPTEGVADGVAQERLAGTPADLARQAQRVRRAELVGNRGTHEWGVGRDVERPTCERQETERVGEPAPVIGGAEQRDRAVEALRRGVLVAADVHGEELGDRRVDILAALKDLFDCRDELIGSGFLIHISGGSCF